MKALLLAGVLAVGVIAESRGADVPDDADVWLTNAVPPAGFTVVHPSRESAGFGLLTAVAADRHMVVRWTPPRSMSGAVGTIRIHASTDIPGARAVRDWREWPTTRTEGGSFEARVPLLTVDVPTAYFLDRQKDGLREASGVREFWPRKAGLHEPTDVFMGFLDGFEAGREGWEIASAVAGGAADGGALTISTNGLSGRAALRVEIPPGRGSVTVGTVRVRGWMLTEHRVDAIRVAARTESGTGRLGCALHTRARTKELAVHPARGEFQLGPGWQRLEVPLDAFVGVRPLRVDWLTLQFFAESGGAVLLDDLELVLR